MKRLRKIYLEISNVCNLHCTFCPGTRREKRFMTADEFATLLPKLRPWTDYLYFHLMGEPLCHPELAEFLRLAGDAGFKVILTTNGTLLEEQLPGLLAAGLTGVNISLDTLNERTFRQITRREGVGRTVKAIDTCLAAGLPVKVNCVPIAPEEELVELAGLAKGRSLAVRFIELMPIGLGKDLCGRSEDELRALLERAYGPLVPFEGRLGSGPSRYVSPPGFQGQIGFISSLSHQFCHRCNRVRLTANGFLKTCLQYDKGVWLRPLLSGSDETLEAAILTAVRDKPAAHQFAQRQVDGGERHIMSQIGG